VLSAHFCENACDNDKKTFETIYGNSQSTAEDLEKIRNMFISSGTLDFANSECKNYTDKAAKILEKLNVTQESKVLLYELLEYMTSRNT